MEKGGSAIQAFSSPIDAMGRSVVTRCYAMSDRQVPNKR
jgi:hypothetical protein